MVDERARYQALDAYAGAYAYPFTGLALGHAGGSVLILKWYKLLGRIRDLLPSFLLFGEIWEEYTDGRLCISVLVF